jgi:hypothetical protein
MWGVGGDAVYKYNLQSGHPAVSRLFSRSGSERIVVTRLYGDRRRRQHHQQLQQLQQQQQQQLQQHQNGIFRLGFTKVGLETVTLL